MSILKVFSAIFFQLLILLSGLVNNVSKPISTSQSDYESLFPTTDFLSPLTPLPVAQEETQDIVINAINPGYTTNEGKNSGELIELLNLSSGEISLDNVAIIYTAKPTSTSPNGKSTILYKFPIGSKLIGETILLRYEQSTEATEGNQDLIYNTSIATIRLDKLSIRLRIQKKSAA